MKQRVKTKPKFNGVSEIKHIEPPFYRRLPVYPVDFSRSIELRPFISVPLISMPNNDMQQHDWSGQQRIWDTSVRSWIIPNASKIPEEDTRVVNITPIKKFQKKEGQIIAQQIEQKGIQKNVRPVVSELSFITQETVVFQRDAQVAIEHTFVDLVKQIEMQHEVALDLVLPLTTFVTMSDVQTIPTYKEKAIKLSLTAIKPKYVEQVIQEPIVESVSVVVQPMLEEEIDVMYKVDQVVIQDLQIVTEIVGKQIVRGESPLCTVKKILWMESNDQDKLVPVEEVEIAQDSTHTLQNLLHFLRKVVHKYCGEDSIRPRKIQQMVSDKWNDEIGEIEEYLTILKTRRMYNHLFAVVN
ncbi:MAG: hypothetical protein ACD_48C00585G0003 [uncultured bacterium]|nr:MAG: hypothetical protein ACD_48C00585G0003 [uncultured bacterium]